MRRRTSRISREPWQERPRPAVFPTFEELGRTKILAEKRGAALEALAHEIELLRDAREVDRATIEDLRMRVASLQAENLSLRGGADGMTA